MQKLGIGLFGLAMAAAVLSSPTRLQAQDFTDTTEIYLSHTVTIGHNVLQRGNYTIEKLDIAGGDSPVLVITDENNVKVKVAARVSPILENRTQPATRVLFYRDGNKYYLDRIWIKGWNYGFQFTNPGNAKKRVAAIE